MNSKQHFYHCKNKTELLLKEVVPRLDKSKKKYFLLVQHGDKSPYVHWTKNDLDFLREVVTQAEYIIEGLINEETTLQLGLQLEIEE